MTINGQEFENVLIQPVYGNVTKITHPGQENDYDGALLTSYKLCKLMDGITSRGNGLTSYPSPDVFIHAIPKEQDTIPVGLKIHFNIPSDNPLFLQSVEQIALLCETANKGGHSTQFKVMKPENQEELRKRDDPQWKKTITLYPRFLKGEKTNTPETIRLVTELRKITKKLKLDIGGLVTLRAGAINKEGEQYERVGRDKSFEEQVVYNLKSPETDSDLFYSQISEAKQQGIF